MIVKLLYTSKTGALFPGVRYNTNKVDRNLGQLMKVANFGALQGLSHLRPEDYINYLQLLANQNLRVRKPQFHAVISSPGQLYTPEKLTRIAEKWLADMGYGNQPYLIIHHKDTANNHVHLVSARVDKMGNKINSAFEKVRAQQCLSRILGYDYAFSYRFSTRAQFLLLVERGGYDGMDPSEDRISQCIMNYQTDPKETLRLRNLLLSLRNHPEMLAMLKSNYGVELILHAAGGKQPYGYTLISHQSKSVFKGSEVLPLRELNYSSLSIQNAPLNTQLVGHDTSGGYLQTHSIYITDDVDDQQIHGMRRRRQRKARLNTR